MHNKMKKNNDLPLVGIYVFMLLVVDPTIGNIGELMINLVEGGVCSSLGPEK